MNELISNPSYMMIGVGAAISILGFFLKKQASQTVRIEEKVREAFERAQSNALPAPGEDRDDDEVRMVY